jgi:hypothetical protein
VVGLATALGTAAAASPDPHPTVTYPNGLVLSLAIIELMPGSDGATCSDAGVCTPGEASGDRLVRVTVSLAWPALEPLALPLDVVAGTASGIGLSAGAARRPAAIDCGNLVETTVLCTDIGATIPAFIAAGSEVRLCESFDVPAGDLDTLVVTVQPPVAGRAGADPLAPATLPAPPVMLRR